MKQIYDFEAYAPPQYTEAELAAEAERRKLRKQTTIVALAGLFSQIALMLAAVCFFPLYPYFALACAAYCVVSMTGGSVLTIIFYQKRRSLT